MTSHPAVRLARNADCHLLPEIERSAARRFRAIGMDDVAEGKVTSADAWEPICENGTLWVAADAEDKPIGFLAAGAQADLLFVYELAVQFEHQGQGFGRELLATAEDYARRHRRAGVVLTTFCDVPWNAPFYERLGFETVADETLPPPIQIIIAAEHDRFPEQDRRRCAMIKALAHE